MQKVDDIIKQIGLDGCDKIEILQKLATTLKVSRPAYIVLGFMVMSVLMIAIGLLDSILTNALCICYPAYMSIKAIESQSVGDDKQWLTYWIVFSSISVIDTFTGSILSFIPFYYMIKLVFLVCLFHPKVQGATIVYDKVIQPLYKTYGHLIDAEIGKIEGKISNITNDLTNKVTKTQ